MNDNKKLSIVILILFAIGAVFTVIWGLFLNQGTLVVEGDAPFEVSVITGPTEKCSQSPCSIEVKPGMHTVIVRKSGFREERQDVEVKRWKDNKIAVDFEFIPVIKEVEGEEAISKTEHFTLQNQGDGRQALMFENTENSEEKVVAYFPKPLEDAEVFTSKTESAVAVLDKSSTENTVYLVDVASSNKQSVFKSTAPIIHISVSPNGKMLTVLTDEKSYLVYENGDFEELNFKIEGFGIDWFDDEILAMVSPTLLSGDVQIKAEEFIQNEGVAFDDYMKILDVANESAEPNLEEKVLFVYFYDFKNKRAERLVTVTGVKNLPVSLTVENGNLFFYDEENKKYQIVLES